MKNLLLLASLLLLTACTGKPEGIEPVADFQAEKYLGRWYEIARLDHRFERGLENITANYSLREDGGIRVKNRGFHKQDGEWKEAEARAYFVGQPDVAHLKVSFFGPFYSSYIVFALDDDYQHALVTSSKKKYLWILSRGAEMDKATLDALLEKARSLGFAVDKLIYVDHRQQ